MSPSGRGFLDAAYQILKEAGHPMHGREIVQACLERGLWATDAVDPNIAGTTTLYSEIRRQPNKRGFTMLGKGQFGLKEWGCRRQSRQRDRLANGQSGPRTAGYFSAAGRHSPSPANRCWTPHAAPRRRRAT